MIGIEKRLNIKFPKEYINFINNINKIKNKNITLLDDDENILIKYFLSLDEESEDSIVKVYSKYRNMMLDGVIAIAETEDEDFICLYYDTNREISPKVILWIYELALDEFGEGMFHISNSFCEFKEKLKIE